MSNRYIDPDRVKREWFSNQRSYEARHKGHLSNGLYQAVSAKSPILATEYMKANKET